VYFTMDFWIYHDGTLIFECLPEEIEVACES
jgi:hypothetical protein